MADAHFTVPIPTNEPVLDYAPGSAEREALSAMLETVATERPEIPVLAGGEAVRTGNTVPVVMPHAHGHQLATLHQAGPAEVEQAIAGALAAAPAWQSLSFEDRAAVFLRAADLLAGKWRSRINAACMLGQSKTCHQSEIDAACELIDFLRYNVAFGEQILRVQPASAAGMWNRSEYRPLEGFVLAITPFNFLSIAVNLAAAPVLMGNVVLWKPSNTSALGCFHMLELLREAGLPEGVISFLPGDGPTQGKVALASENLAGIHFTGSTATFRSLWRQVAEGLDRYRSFPRMVGETGGKDFVLVHPSADVEAVATAIVRGGYEYQGQKCSAPSRVYVPKSLWPGLRDRLSATVAELKVGDIRDFSCFMGAVIDEKAFDRIAGYQKLAKDSGKIIVGGSADKRQGYFVSPTLVEVDDPKHRLMQEEVFGPIVTVWVYEDRAWEDVLALLDETSPYALTGAVFARDRMAIADAQERLRQSAGNFYINDKPTGAVVGQQPFGGARASGTNDKAGAMWNLLRWTSPRSIKETFSPPVDYRYPYMG